ESHKRKTGEEEQQKLQTHIRNLNSKQISRLINYKRRGNGIIILLFLLTTVLSLMPGGSIWAQGTEKPIAGSLLGEAGIIITIILLLVPILFAVIFLIVKIVNALNQARNQRNIEE